MDGIYIYLKEDDFKFYAHFHWVLHWWSFCLKSWTLNCCFPRCLTSEERGVLNMMDISTSAPGRSSFVYERCIHPVTGKLCLYRQATITRCDLSATILFTLGDSYLIAFKSHNNVTLPRLRNHNATDDGNADFRSFRKFLRSRLGKFD